MKKIILPIVLFLMLLVTPTFAASSPESAIQSYYKACESGNVDAVLQAMDLEYVEEYLAEIDIYRAYIEAAFQVAKTDSIKLSNIKLNVDETSGVALGSVDVLTNAVLLEDKSPIQFTNTFVVFLTLKNGEWKVAVTMEKEIFNLEIEEALMEQYIAMTEELTNNDLARYESVYSSKGQVLVAPSEVNMDGAVVLPNQVAALTQGEAIVEEEETDYTELFAEKIAEYEAHEKRSSFIKIFFALLILGGVGAGVFWFMKYKKI